MRRVIYFRKRVTVLTDPQRRVYHGVPFSSEQVWTEWAPLYGMPNKAAAESSAAGWRALNPHIQYEVRPE
jgi:hypothetical protein